MPPKDATSKGAYEMFFAPLDNPTEFHPIGKFITNGLTIGEDEEPTAIVTIPTTGKFEFSIGNAQIDNDTITKLFAAETVRKDCTFSVIIQMGKEYIYRPRNLKYPNKKRAKRIWKKWRSRYGVAYPEHVVLPNCTITTQMRDGDFYNEIEAQ